MTKMRFYITQTKCAFKIYMLFLSTLTLRTTRNTILHMYIYTYYGASKDGVTTSQYCNQNLLIIPIHTLCNESWSALSRFILSTNSWI